MSIQAVGDPSLNPPGFDPRNRGYNPSGGSDRSMEQNIARLADALAPAQQMTSIPIVNVAVGDKVGTIQLQLPFNGLIASIIRGSIDVYFGPDTKAVPDMQFNPSVNPVYIPLPKRNDQYITLVVDSASSDPGFGTIHVVSY